MSDKTPTPSSGIGFLEALTLLFVAAKLFGVINWSWWWIFAPIWVTWIAVLAFLGIAFVVAAIMMDK